MDWKRNRQVSVDIHYLLKVFMWEILRAWNKGWQGKCEACNGRNVLRESRTFNRLDMVTEKEGGVTCDKFWSIPGFVISQPEADKLIPCEHLSQVHLCSLHTQPPVHIPGDPPRTCRPFRPSSPPETHTCLRTSLSLKTKQLDQRKPLWKALGDACAARLAKSPAARACESRGLDSSPGCHRLTGARHPTPGAFGMPSSPYPPDIL